MKKPLEALEPAEVDPRKLRRTAFILLAIGLVGGFIIYFAHLRALEREAEDPRPAIISRLSNAKDFAFVRQDGSSGKMSDLYGDVWLVCGISLKQPETWATTREVLKRVSLRYADRKEFHIVCLPVDTENLEQDAKAMSTLADELGAKLPLWWIAAAGQKYVQEFLKNDLKLEIIPALKDGKWEYDPSITVIDRDRHLRKGTLRVSKHLRRPFPFNFEEAVKLDREQPLKEGPQVRQEKLEQLLDETIDYVLNQPITKS